MSVNEYLIDAYRVSKSVSNSRHERMLYVKNSFIKDYGQEGIDKYFDGSAKKLWFAIEDLIQ